jgi:hypothetical protein
MSCYVVNASANAGGLGLSDVNSTPSSHVSASVSIDPFLDASANASELVLGAMALTGIPGGAGEAGSGAGSKILYTISGTPANSTSSFTLTFDATGTLVAIPTGNGKDIAAFDFGTNVTVGTDLETVQSNGSASISGSPGSLSPTQITGFTLTQKPNLSNLYGVLGVFTVTVEAKQFLIVNPTISLEIAVSGAEGEGALNLGLASITASNSAGGTPELTPQIQTTPEPGSWGILTCGLGLLGWTAHRIKQRAKSTVFGENSRKVICA